MLLGKVAYNSVQCCTSWYNDVVVKRENESIEFINNCHVVVVHLLNVIIWHEIKITADLSLTTKNILIIGLYINIIHFINKIRVNKECACVIKWVIKIKISNTNV